MRRDLSGMVVVITGASAGIGQALAEQVAARGGRLALAARRVERLEALNARIGGGHLCVATDVADRGQCETLIARAIERFGRLDTLVCNAGFGILRPVAEAPPEEIERQFRTNLLGTLDCIRPAVPVMAAQQPRDGWRGQIVIVSSAVARRGLPYFGVYSATKAAQLSCAEALRVELKPRRIAVTSVHPIGTDTEFTEACQREGRSAARIHAGTHEPRQSAAAVARTILRAIERPRAEVWPYAAARWAIGLGTLFPSLVDRVMERRVVREEK
jgi:NAD(P)-dependent dehydrogenase (short-subunit alcohol dehydrogenase family)